MWVWFVAATTLPRSSAEPPPFRHAKSVPPFPLSGKSTPQSSAKPSGRRLVFFLRTTSSKISRGAGENEIMPFPFAKTIVLLLHGSPSAYSLAIKDCSVTRTCELKVTVDRAGNEIMPFPFAKLFQQFCGNLGVCRLLYAIDTRTCHYKIYKTR